MTHVTRELRQAVTEAEGALNERDRLQTLANSLAADHTAAEAEQREAAGAEVELALAASDSETTERAKAARARTVEADATLLRIANVRAALPSKVVQSDARLTEAATVLAAALQSCLPVRVFYQRAGALGFGVGCRSSLARVWAAT